MKINRKAVDDADVTEIPVTVCVTSAKVKSSPPKTVPGNGQEVSIVPRQVPVLDALHDFTAVALTPRSVPVHPEREYVALYEMTTSKQKKHEKKEKENKKQRGENIVRNEMNKPNSHYRCTMKCPTV